MAKGRYKVTGGRKLQTFVGRAIRDQRRGVKGIRLGFLADAKYQDGTQVASVAMWNEYGTSRMAARPYFRSSLQRMRFFLHTNLRHELNPRNMTVDDRIGKRMGLGLRGVLQTSITEWNVIDTGHMKQSVDFELLR